MWGEMKKEHVKKLIKLFNNDHSIYYLVDIDDYYGWVVVDGANIENLSMSFDIVDNFIYLTEDKYNINDFKVYKKVEDWWK